MDMDVLCDLSHSGLTLSTRSTSSFKREVTFWTCRCDPLRDSGYWPGDTILDDGNWGPLK